MIGALELCLLTFTPLIDPVEKQKLKSNYLAEDINCLKHLSTTYDCMRIVMHYKNFGVKIYDAFATRLHVLLEQRDKCATKVALRPQKCSYSALVQDITHFLHTNCDPAALHKLLQHVQAAWRILHAHELNAEQLSSINEVLSKLDLWIANSQRFMNHILKPYKGYYEDFLQPLQCAVDQMRFGLEGLKLCLSQIHAAIVMRPKSQRYINLNAEGRLHEVLLNVLAFPSAQKLNIFDEHSPRDIFKNRAHIFTMLEALPHSERVYYQLLQAKLYELLQTSQIASIMGEQDFQAYDYALHICNEVWQAEETLRRQQKAEEESLYVQKTHCAEEDEELVELQEISENFPTDLEADFGDFIVQDTLEKVMKLDKKPLKKKSSHILGDEEYAFLAENFMQIMLEHTKVYYHQPKTQNQNGLQLLAPFQQRLSVFVQLFAQYKTALNESMDTAVYNSFTLALGLQQQLLNEIELNQGGSSANVKTYNFYKDANIPEVRSCCEILSRIESLVQQQLELYAEHATLEDILRIIERIRQLPANASLVRFNMGFQLLRQKIAQWNEVAHKGNHLRDEEIVIAEHVQRWTRLELQCWRNCLQQTEQKMAGQAYRYWFFIYNLLQEYFTRGNLDSSYTDIKHTEQRFGEGHLLDVPTSNMSTTKVTLEEIVRILRQFIESANYGDFHMRLRLLHAFELYLHNVKNHIVSEDERLLPLIASLRNLQIYYAQFGTEIADSCKNMRAPIEKKLKEFVKIESYNKDLSYFSMRNNVARVHRQLNKFLREYRTQLQEKIIKVFQPRDATAKDYQFRSEKDYETRFKYYKQPTRLFIASLKLRDLYASDTIGDSQKLMQRVSQLFINSRNVVKSTVENAKYPQLIMSLDELFSSQLERCEHLRNLNVDRTREKAQQKVEAKQILQQKRKALVDLFKILAQLGVSYKSGLMELGLRTEFADFTLQPFCIKSMLLHNSKQINLLKLNEHLDTYYAKCVFKLRLLQNIMLTPLSELGPPTIERIKGCAIDLFLLVQKQRDLLAHSSKSIYDLRMGLQNLREIASTCDKQALTQNLSFALSRDKFVALKASICQIRFVLEQLQLVLKCAPTQQSTETHVFAEADASFLKHSSHFVKLEELCEKILKLCKDTLQDMFAHDIEFLSYNKIKTYLGTHKKLIELIKQLKSLLNGSQSETENTMPLAQPLDDLLKIVEKSHEIENVSESPEINFKEIETALERVLHSVLLALQKLYKKYSEDPTTKMSPTKTKQDELEDTETENEVIEEQHLRKKLLEELTVDWEILNLPHIVQQLSHILLSLKHADISDEKLDYCRRAVTMLPLLEQYQLMADYYLFQQLGSHKVTVKMLSVLLTVFVEIGTNGFCVPPDLMQDEDGDKKGEQKEGEGFGLEDGTGDKDASDKLESEDQLDDAKRPEDRKDEGDKEEPDCKEEKGIEMSDDFDGKMQDVEKPENEEDDSGESEEEDELNKEMGETEDGAEKLDDQIWGDDEEPEEEEEEKDMEEEDGKGSKDEKDSHNDLDSKNDAAKEDGKNNEEKEGLDATDEPSGDDKKKQQEKDINNMKDQDGDDEQTNPYHNELEEPPEPEDMDLGELNHDNEEDHEEGEDREGDENPFDIDRMKENMPATEDTSNDADEEAAEDNVDENNDNDEDSESDAEAGTELKEDPNVDEDKEPKKDENEQEDVGEPETQKRGELEQEETAEENEEQKEENHEEKPEEHAQSKDKSSKEENVQSVPDTDDKATADQVESAENDKNVKQEDKLDEQDTGEEKDGVGQAENEEQDGGHKGIAETKETIAREDSKNERKPKEKRKQGKTDEERTLGEAEQNKLKQLKTIDKLKQQNEKEKDSLEEEQTNDIEMEAEEYQHVKEPKNSDKTTLDNATEEQSKQIKHQEDEEKNNKEDAENPDDMNVDEEEPMQVDDDINEDLEQMEADKLEQKSDKPSKSDKTKERTETQQEQIEVEGEYALTMDVSRGTDTTAHCSKDILLDTSQAEELSIAETLELRRQYQQQITTNLAKRPEHDDYETWQSVSQRMSQSARELCEQLRLILEPTKCTRLKGDYRTGRRINMKKIIPYIASQFRKDKIWLRRTKPAQRDYKITIAIDDSKSMHHNNSKTLTLEAISLVSQALTLLESGRLSIVSFGERSQIVLNHTEQFDGPKLVNALNFEQDKTKIAELLDFIRIANTEEGLGGSENGLFENLLLILSDGRNIFGEGKLKVKNAIKLARLQRIFLVYIIIDNPENKNSILDIQTMEMLPDKRITIKSYLDDFPFPYYVIVRDLNQLPLVLSEAMRQWFELVNSEQ